MKVRQFKLSDEHGAETTCWLEDDRRLKRGVRLTTKQTGEQVWTVVAAYDLVLDRDDLNRKWNVGGLLK